MDVEFDYYLRLLPAETVSHIFWECPHVHEIIQKFYRLVRGLDWYRGNEVIDKKCFFLGIGSEFKGIVEVDLIWKHYVKFFLFQCKLRKKMPTFASLRYEFEGIMAFKTMQLPRFNLMHINTIYNGIEQ